MVFSSPFLGLLLAWVSPEVHPDRTVTFRFQDPGAREVVLAREEAPASVAMTKGPDGVWTVTVGPLEPDFYAYNFIADGQALIDPNNSLIKPSLQNVGSLLHVPGPKSLPWESGGGPHGDVTHHRFHSAATGHASDYYVYTPPGYDRASPRTYPVLYLLHGYGDDAGGWTQVGRADVILDNLIAAGWARPMIVVMPLGYGTPEIVARDSGLNLQNIPWRTRNYERFIRSLTSEVMPQVEGEYAVAPGRENRAIAGLSMGGTEALLVGLSHREQFAWIGSFSAGAIPDDFAADFPQATRDAGGPLRLLYLSCGREDPRAERDRQVAAWLRERGVAVLSREPPGGHTWPVWRRNLADFTPMLFSH